MSASITYFVRKSADAVDYDNDEDLWERGLKVGTIQQGETIIAFAKRLSREYGSTPRLVSEMDNIPQLWKIDGDKPLMEMDGDRYSPLSIASWEAQDIKNVQGKLRRKQAAFVFTFPAADAVVRKKPRVGGHLELYSSREDILKTLEDIGWLRFERTQSTLLHDVSALNFGSDFVERDEPLSRFAKTFTRRVERQTSGHTTIAKDDKAAVIMFAVGGPGSGKTRFLNEVLKHAARTVENTVSEREAIPPAVGIGVTFNSLQTVTPGNRNDSDWNSALAIRIFYNYFVYPAVAFSTFAKLFDTSNFECAEVIKRVIEDVDAGQNEDHKDCRRTQLILCIDETVMGMQAITKGRKKGSANDFESSYKALIVFLGGLLESNLRVHVLGSSLAAEQLALAAEDSGKGIQVLFMGPLSSAAANKLLGRYFGKMKDDDGLTQFKQAIAETGGFPRLLQILALAAESATGVERVSYYRSVLLGSQYFTDFWKKHAKISDVAVALSHCFTGKSVDICLEKSLSAAVRTGLFTVAARTNRWTGVVQVAPILLTYLLRDEQVSKHSHALGDLRLFCMRAYNTLENTFKGADFEDVVASVIFLRAKALSFPLKFAEVSIADLLYPAYVDRLRPVAIVSPFKDDNFDTDVGVGAFVPPPGFVVSPSYLLDMRIVVPNEISSQFVNKHFDTVPDVDTFVMSRLQTNPGSDAILSVRRKPKKGNLSGPVVHILMQIKQSERNAKTTLNTAVIWGDIVLSAHAHTGIHQAALEGRVIFVWVALRTVASNVAQLHERLQERFDKLKVNHTKPTREHLCAQTEKIKDVIGQLIHRVVVLPREAVHNFLTPTLWYRVGESDRDD